MTSVALTQRMSKAAAERPELSERISKAAAIVREHLAHRDKNRIRGRVTVEGMIWSVAGSKGARYTVVHTNAGGWSCDCPDHRNRPAIPCKHILAIKALCLAHEPGTAAPAAQGDERARRDARSIQLEDGNRAARRARRPRVWQGEECDHS